MACASDLPDVEGDGSSTTSTTLEGGGTNTSQSGETTVDLNTTTSEATTDETSTTGPPPMCDEPDGTYMSTCPEDAPFCVGEMCTDCDNDVENTRCIGVGEAPGDVCADDGRCVMCTSEDATACVGSTPICDPGTNACVACTEHAQCGMAACNLFTGQCVDGMVVNAVPGPSSLANAVGEVTAMGGGTIILAEGAYDETITVSGGAIVAFRPGIGASPEWQRTAGLGAPQLRVTDGATVLIDGIVIRINDSVADPALRVDDAMLWVDRSTIAQNSGVAVRAELNAVVKLRNCFVAGPIDLPAINVVTGADMAVQYSTVGANLGSSNAILCDAASTVMLRDSVVLTRGIEPEIACAMLDAEHTAANTLVPGVGNVAVNATNTAWFTSYNSGDFHLVGQGLTTFEGIAEWNLGDPSVDIDGQPRARAERQLEYAGADLP